MYACLEENADRICLGADEAGLRVPVLAVSRSQARLLRPEMADPLLSEAFSSTAVWTHPIARIVPFDHESPAEAFDQPVRAELISAMAQQRPSITVRALTEQAVRHSRFMAGPRRADSCAPSGTPLAGRPRRSRNASATNAQPGPQRNELLSSVPPRPSTAVAVHRATRQYGEVGPAAPGAGARFPARWTFFRTRRSRARRHRGRERQWERGRR